MPAAAALWSWARQFAFIQHHRQKRVIAVHSDQVDDSLLAELCLHARIGRIAHALVLMQLGGKIVDHFFIGRHALRTAAFSKGLRNFRFQACLYGDGLMQSPLVLLAPTARGNQDGEFIKLRRQHALVTQIVTHGLGAKHHFRTAQQRHKRTKHRSLAFRGKIIGGFLLLRCELVRGNRRHAVGWGRICRRCSLSRSRLCRLSNCGCSRC